MDLRQLEYFVTVARFGQFTQSAEHLRVGQPGLSQGIRRLEGAVGTPLLDRSARPVTLTSAGEALMPYAERAVAALEGIREVFHLEEHAPVGKVTVGVMSLSGPIEGVVANYHTRFPEVEVDLREGVTSELLNELLAHRVDAIIATRYTPLPEAIESRTAYTEPLMLMVPADRSFPETVTLNDLNDERILMPAAGSGFRKVLVAGLQRAGITWRRGPESNDVKRQAALVMQGVGVAIVPQSVTRMGEWPVQFVRLDDPMRREVAVMLARERRQPSAVRAFVDVALAELASFGSDS